MTPPGGLLHRVFGVSFALLCRTAAMTYDRHEVCLSRTFSLAATRELRELVDMRLALRRSGCGET